MISIAEKRIQPLLNVMHAISRKLENIPLSMEIAVIWESLGTEDSAHIDLSTITNLLLKLFGAIKASTGVALTEELEILTDMLYKKDAMQSSIVYTSDERALYKEFETLFDLMIERLYLSENAIMNLDTILFTPALFAVLQAETIEAIKLRIQRQLWRFMERGNTAELQRIIFLMPHLKELLSKEDLASRLPDEFSKFQTLAALLTFFEESQPDPLVAIVVNTQAELHAVKATAQTLGSLGIPYRINQLPHACTELLPMFVGCLQKDKVKVIISSNQKLSSAIIGTAPRMSVITASHLDNTFHVNPVVNAALRTANTLAPFYPEIDQKLQVFNENARQEKKRSREVAEPTQQTKRKMLITFDALEIEEFSLGADEDPDAVRLNPSRQQITW